MPNFNNTFIIKIDASSESIRAVFQQLNKPIEFMSQALGVFIIIIKLFR